MIETSCKVRVRYSETDQMGYVYYGNYATFYEVARVEMFRTLGTSYKEMEDSGIMMPVLELKCKYIKPALYDQELNIRVQIREKPAARIRFNYEIFNPDGVLINEGETTLVFVDMKRNRPCLPPEDFQKRLAPYFTP